MSFKKIILAAIAILFAGLAYYLFRPLSIIPEPAEFDCLELTEGTFMSKDSLPTPQHIYGMGLTYSQHLIETAAEFDPDAPPPIFKKSISSITGDQVDVMLPSRKALIEASGYYEPGVSQYLADNFKSIDPLLDYEVELGFVLLEDIAARELNQAGFIPQIGFFLANDLSARAIALLGEGTNQRYEYWGISKSFPGFTPMTDQIWIPHTPSTNSIPCIQIETYVNGAMRQSQTTDNMVFTPLEMLKFIQEKYPNNSLRKGDLILTGTPGGVAIATPRVLVRLSNLLGFDRYKKLSIKLDGDLSSFLKNGDEVQIRGNGLGDVTNTIIEE